MCKLFLDNLWIIPAVLWCFAIVSALKMRKCMIQAREGYEEACKIYAVALEELNLSKLYCSNKECNEKAAEYYQNKQRAEVLDGLVARSLLGGVCPPDESRGHTP